MSLVVRKELVRKVGGGSDRYCTGMSEEGDGWTGQCLVIKGEGGLVGRDRSRGCGLVSIMCRTGQSGWVQVWKRVESR